MLKIVSLLIATLLITSCDSRVVIERVGVSVDTNAYYTAYQKASTSEWNQINFNNAAYEPETLSFTLEELTDSYGVVFVCPSQRRGVPHKVFAYFATGAEMTLLDFSCKKPPQDVLQSSMYGVINGVTPATLANPQGELVKVALSSTRTVTALQAFAAEVPIGTRDVVAIKGLQKAGENTIDTPKQFAIYRGFTELNEKPQKTDFSFDGSSFANSLPGYSADFNQADESSVVITGVNENDVLLTEVGFLSINKTLINLVSTDQSTAKFLPVPLDEFTNADLGGFFNLNEFQPSEGHELSATVKTADGLIEREVREFFTLPISLHTLNLPKAIDFAPTFLVTNEKALQKINPVWSEYKDDASGKTQLYRWVFEGSAGKLSGKNLPSVEVKGVQWLIHITPGWLSNANRTAGTFSLSLPVKFDSVATSGGRSVDVWSDSWSFESGTPIDWELTVFVTDEKGSSGAIIEYLLNRNFAENYRFSKVYLRSSVGSP